jgi:hypothetical protein
VSVHQICLLKLLALRCYRAEAKNGGPRATAVCLKTLVAVAYHWTGRGKPDDIKFRSRQLTFGPSPLPAPVFGLLSLLGESALVVQNFLPLAKGLVGNSNGAEGSSDRPFRSNVVGWTLF